MRNDYSDKLNTSGLQNHYVPGSPTLNHNSHFSKDSKNVCSESKEFNAILDLKHRRRTAAELEDHRVLLIATYRLNVSK